MSLGNVSFGQPINRQHPLNAGLTSILHALPNYTSSLRILGLHGGGSLTMTASTAGWIGAGFGCKSPPGSALGTYTLGTAIDTSAGGSELTIEFVATWLGTDSGTANISGLYNLGSNASTMRLGDSGLTPRQAQLNDNAGNLVTSTPEVTAFRRFSLVATYHNSNGVELYLDGASVGTHAYRANLTGSTVAMLSDDSGRAGGTMIHRFAIYNRRKTAGEVALLSDQAQRDWPDLLNRLSRRVYSFAVSGGATFNPGWANRATTTVGAAF